MVVQIFAVVVGILLALAINRWHTNRANAARAAEANVALNDEVTANDRGVTHALSQVATFSAAMARDAPPARSPSLPCNEYSGWPGLSVPLLLDAAYRTSIASQAFADMSFARARQIAYVYAEQQAFENHVRNTVQFLVQGHPYPYPYCQQLVVNQRTWLERLHTVYRNFLRPAGSAAR
ncbi:MAG: hypothetical protein ACREP0_04475 [Rhodanobacteraceae bacterium]